MPEIDDKELQELVDVLNQVEGFVTIDSCFGHSEEPDRLCNHNSHAFVGISIDSHNKKANELMARFVQTFNSKGKWPTPINKMSWIQISVSKFVGYRDDFFRIEFDPCHNPAFKKEGHNEKLFGINLVTKWFKNNILEQPRSFKKYDPDNPIHHGTLSDKIKLLKKQVKAIKKLKKKLK